MPILIPIQIIIQQLVVIQNNSQMYGKLNERKLHQNDYIMSCEKAREELGDYINDEAKRTNIDSAKKRAVVQHMDYDGFRQMVLGAHIFPTKSKELYTFTKGEPVQPGQIKQEQPAEQGQTTKKITIEGSNMPHVIGKSQMHCNSFREFKKKFNEQFSKQFDPVQTEYCYNLIKQQNEARVTKIFNAECEGVILVKISQIFQRVLQSMSKQGNQSIVQQAQFMLNFYKTLINIPTMKSMTLAVLSKKQKQTIVEILNKLKQNISQEDSQEQINKISNVFQK